MIWSETDAGGAIAVTVPDQASLLGDIAERFDTGRGFSVATLNLDHVVKLSRDPAFRAAYGAQTHVTADGNPIVWLSRLAGERNVRLVPGSELIGPVAALAAEKGVPVAFFGSDEATLEAAALALEARNPGLRVVCRLAPPMGFDPEGPAAEEAIAAIAASGARLVFVAIGAPKQEMFAAQAQHRMPEAGFISVGAGLDFIAGRQKRAPAWLRGVAGEWLWRLFGDPKRLAGRYGACLLKLPELTLKALSARFRRPVP